MFIGLNKYSFFIPIFCIIFLFSLYSKANEGIQINQTRVIIYEKMKSAPITLTNNGASPFLIKSEISKRINQSHSEDVPFIIMPPLFKLEANNRHTALVLNRNNEDLPSDRESVFYISLLAIPSSKEPDFHDLNNMSGQVFVGIQSVIKLFYRPNNLPSQKDYGPDKLTFNMTDKGLIINNPTPYHITLSRLIIDEYVVNVREQGSMLNPLESKEYLVSTKKAHSIKWNVINDYGGESDEYHFILPDTLSRNR